MELKHVLLECPYDTWNDPESQKFFCSMIGLRLTGYLKEYRYGVLPFDTSDFVAAHYLICEAENGQLTPVACMKGLSLLRCQTHDLAFPVIAGLNTIGAQSHLGVVQKVIDRFSNRAHALFYEGGMTIHPRARADKALAAKLMEHLKAAWLGHQLEHGVEETVAFAAVRFKMSRAVRDLGYENIELDGEELPPVSMPTLMNGHEAMIIHRKQYSAAALELEKKYRFWRKARIEINVSSIGVARKIA